MSDIFWVTGTTVEKTKPRLAVAEVLNAAGVQPSWVDQVHWIVEQDSQPEGVTTGLFPVVFHWPRQVLLTDFLLHDVCRSLMIREQNLALIAEEEGGLVHFTVLCSPQSVGRYNLLPHAHIAGWWTLPPTGLTTLPQKLEKSGYDLDCVQWLAGELSLVEQAKLAFPEARLVDQGFLSTIGRLNQLIHRLDKEKCSHGLLLANSLAGPVLATLVER
jgi:hypothetical protein